VGEIKLDDICDAIVDCEHKTAPLVAFGYPSVRTTNIKNGRIDWDNCNRLDPATYEAWTRRRVPAPGDLILAREAPVGEVGLIPEGVQAVLGQRTVLICPDHRKVDSRYLHFLLISPDVQTDMLGKAAGSTVEHLNMSDIRALPLPELPPLPEQRAIARVLGGLDDKIELNRRMNRTLEDLARGLFRSWFVDFDPVIKGANATAPAALNPRVASPGGGLPIARPLWPKRLIDSALGPIPEGWRVGTVADICTTQYGYTASATDEAVGPRMLRVTDMNKEPWVEWADVPHCRIDDDLLPRYALKVGDVLVSRMADPGKAAIVEEELPEGAVFASYLIRLATRSIAASYYLFYFLRSDQYLDYAESVSGGTVQKNMNAQVITAASMVIAPISVADEFARLVRPWRQCIARNLQESRSLAALRDALLPQLLSGDIRLREAQRTIDDSLQANGQPLRAAQRAAARVKGSE